MKKKVIGLLSGGLDSSLACKIIQGLGDLEIIALNFMSPFCTCNRKNGTNGNGSCKNIVLNFARKEGITIKLVYLGEEYLEIVRNPRYGYGKNLNPCLDCRILMFKKAKQVLEETRAEFIFTGEVLGQRPMSQRRDTFGIIERESGLKGLILRPLSAGLLPPTLPEIKGLISREKLLSFSGRSRKPQIKSADTYGLNDYPCPAGGCLLTEANFARRVKDLFIYSEKVGLKDVEMLKIGRHFRLSSACKVIVGRNKAENEKLDKMLGTGNYRFRVLDYQGPLVTIQGTLVKSLIPLVSRITVRYSDAPREEKVSVCFAKNSAGEEIIKVRALEENLISALRI